jgi:hypothetical protein
MKKPPSSLGGRGHLSPAAACREFQIQHDYDHVRVGVQGMVARHLARHQALADAGRPNLAG